VAIWIGILDFLDGLIKKIANILVLSDFRFLIRILDDKQIDCSVRVFLISV
jgi:hypothetical protein